MVIDNETKQNLRKEIPLLRAQIQALYRELDSELGLHGADVPVTFGYEEDVLGAYRQGSEDEKTHFHFSLLFIGYSVKKPLSKEDRIDLFKHEYAHYMQYNMEIPDKYQWQPGIHGSAWKYCCSLVGAAPTPYYKAGESLMAHNYDKVLKNPIKDKTIPIRDQYRKEKDYQRAKDNVVQFKINDAVLHPKFGAGTVENIHTGNGSVRLSIRFGGEVKVIDQKWLLKTRYKSRKSERKL